MCVFFSRVKDRVLVCTPDIIRDACVPGREDCRRGAYTQLGWPRCRVRQRGRRGDRGSAVWRGAAGGVVPRRAPVGAAVCCCCGPARRGNRAPAVGVPGCCGARCFGNREPFVGFATPPFSQLHSLRFLLRRHRALPKFVDTPEHKGAEALHLCLLFFWPF